MTESTIKPDKTVAALIHLSTFTQFFFPFGNFIFPLIFWTAKKNDPFVNEHGKQALNFQISLFLYLFFLMAISLTTAIIIGIGLNFDETLYINSHRDWIQILFGSTPVIVFFSILVVLILILIVLNIYATVNATIKAGEGKLYKYPLAINFLNSGNYKEPIEHNEASSI